MLERPDEDVAHFVAVKHREDGVGVFGRVEQPDVAAAALELGRRAAATPETLVVVPAEDGRKAGRAADAAVVRVRVARRLGEDGAVGDVRTQPLDRGAVAGRVALHPREPVQPVHRARPPEPEENGRERVGKEARRADEKGGADESARAARRERKRQEEGTADHEERPRSHERLEHRVHPPELVAVRVRHEDDVRHGGEHGARGGEEEAGAQGAGRGGLLAFGRRTQEEPEDAGCERRREAENGALRQDRKRQTERRERGRRDESAVLASLRAHERDAERERGHDAQGAEVEERLTRGRRLLPEREPMDRGPRRAEERDEERDGEEEREEAADDRRPRRALHEVARGEDEEARREIPRVRREDGREEDAVEERARGRPDPAGEAGEREEERERDGVRVEVPEAEREERPLRDRVLDAAGGGPPVEVDERLFPEGLARAVERAAEDEDGAREDGEPPTAPARPHGAVRGERGEGREERGDQVVRVLRRDARRAGREREEVRSEVVVREALAGEPRIHEREARRRHESGEDSEVHRLFGLPDLAERAADPEEEEEDEGEEDERREERPPAREDRGEVAPAPQEQGSEREARERQRDGRDGGGKERRDDPSRERRGHEADRERERDGRFRTDVVRPVAAQKAGKDGRSRRARQEEDRGEEKRGHSRHGTGQGNTTGRLRRATLGR